MENHKLLENVNSFLSRHANLLVALATFFLAFLTYRYIGVTTKMVEETKRLADTSAEQFKIKSYPVFLVVPSSPVFDSGQFLQEFAIHNRGEIAAHKVTFLLVNIYFTKGNKMIYLAHEGTYYEFEGTRRSIDVESKIPAGSNRRLMSSIPLSKLDDFERFSHALVFVRFKVPYDTVHSLEVVGYTLKEISNKPGSKSLAWQELSASDEKVLVDQCIRFSASWAGPSKSFFTDFRLME